MKRKELIKLLEEQGFRPGKILGQNFLTDENLLNFIVSSAAPQPGETILEVGPGFGALTRKLLASGCLLTSVEFDHRICEYLRNNIKEENFTLVEGDAVRVNFEELFAGKPFRAIANLPYSISSIFIANLLELTNPPQEMFFMLQKEMALRLTADNSTKNYGALSIRTQSFYDAKILRSVPPQVFHPAPDVDSAIVGFYRKKNALELPERLQLKKIVKCVFTQRRKKMVKPLSMLFPKEQIFAAYKAMNIREDIRPGALTVEQFIELSELLNKR